MFKDNIQSLKPTPLWRRFYEISQYPRPSKNEKKIIEYLKKTASELNVAFEEDSIGNIIYKVPSNSGFDDAPVITLQAHIDMVCEKNKNTRHDFNNDPIKLIEKNGWVKAVDTTLGADNGIGVSAALAIIEDSNIKRGPLECLFTVDEETGLTGSNNLRRDFIKGKYLLNLDSEEDGVFYIGCAGGVDIFGEIKAEYEPFKSDFENYKLVISGLRGGHSGMDINARRANAIKLLARTLNALMNIDYQIYAISGGDKSNAIPREAEAGISLPKRDITKAVRIIDDFHKAVKKEYALSEQSISIELLRSQLNIRKALSKKTKNDIMNALLAIPHGVVEMSHDIPDLVETSINLASVLHEEGKITIATSQRSSIESARDAAALAVISIFKMINAKYYQIDEYPGWNPELDSKLLRISKTVYESIFDRKPAVKAIHAGLECGILKAKYPNVEMISFGPAIEGAHSPDERVNIASVERFYKLLTAIIEKLSVSN